MNVREAATRNAARARRRGAKREERKREIAARALEALKTYGCAGTTLRDIAERSQLSLGMLHYYFDDRQDLVIYCLDLYREEYLARFERLVTAAETRDDMIAVLAAGIADGIVDEPVTNRFWYDIRTQAMFDPAFLPVVRDFEDALMAFGRRIAARAGYASSDIELRFVMLEGAFRYFTQRQINGEGLSKPELRKIFERVLSVELR